MMTTSQNTMFWEGAETIIDYSLFVSFSLSCLCFVSLFVHFIIHLYCFIIVLPARVNMAMAILAMPSHCERHLAAKYRGVAVPVIVTGHGSLLQPRFGFVCFVGFSLRPRPSSGSRLCCVSPFVSCFLRAMSTTVLGSTVSVVSFVRRCYRWF